MKIRMPWSVLIVAALFAAACGKKEERAMATVAEPETAAEAAAAAAAEPAEAAAEPAEVVVYELDGRTLLGWTGYKMVGSHFGSFLYFEGRVEIPDGDVTRAKMECVIEMDSLESDNATLTAVMKTDKMLNVEVHPEGFFTSRAIRKTASGYEVTGALTLLGVERVITFPAEIALEEGVFTLASTFEADRNWWGITWKGFGDNIMRDNVTIRLNVVAKAAE